MVQSLKIAGLGTAHVAVVPEGVLQDGFFEPSSAKLTGTQTGAILRCDLREGVRFPNGRSTQARNPSRCLRRESGPPWPSRWTRPSKD